MREDGVALTQFMLVFNVQLLEPQATPSWTEFARMDRGDFEERAGDLAGPGGRLAVLRKVAAASADAS